MNAGDLIMQAGRPVFAVPNFRDGVKLERAIIAWKDTSETRRAALDALPLLKALASVTVVEIALEDELPAARSHVGDVIGWLKRHGIVADSIASASMGDDSAQLNNIAKTQDADMIVAGAYGHSRVREWALGGVTRDLLHRADRCLLVSH
jgi:nucleotide-binding universal stress UspA family protein